MSHVRHFPLTVRSLCMIPTLFAWYPHVPYRRQWSVAIKDTIDEFVEAAKAAALANVDKPGASKDAPPDHEEFAAKVTVGGDESGEGGRPDHDDFNFDDMDEDYCSMELKCVEASIDILRVFRRCLKEANESLNTLDSAQSDGADGGAATGSPGKEWLQGKLEWAQSVQAHLEDANEFAGEVGILLYPPLDGGELLDRAKDLTGSINAFCDSFFACKEGGDTEREASLRMAVQDKLGVLRAAVETL